MVQLSQSKVSVPVLAG